MKNTEQQLDKMRHTLSHILAAAVKELYPTTTFGVGPTVDNGFYYDIDFGDVKVSDADLPKIEKKMHSIVARKLEMTRSTRSRVEALNWARENKQKFKVELIEDLPADSEISFYSLGDIFEDLCKGPHVKNTSEIGAFKLVRVAGAYWRGDEKKEMLTRIYGVAFATQEELDAYVKQQEEAKARDHRKLGKELDLFCFSDLVGAG
ncbi:threonine--tRNA ligase, partial [Candidatus Saccharibacteria bacterium]|nr:threonine--tRNA ligase [Candidatus Saccharibacteria bacterium]